MTTQYPPKNPVENESYTAGRCPACGVSVYVRPSGLIAAHIAYDENHKNPRACKANLTLYRRIT